jgi:hypothetical protein
MAIEHKNSSKYGNREQKLFKIWHFFFIICSDYCRVRICITLMWTQIQFSTLMQMRIRILLLIKVMGICYHWSVDPPELHFNPLTL